MDHKQVKMKPTVAQIEFRPDIRRCCDANRTDNLLLEDFGGAIENPFHSDVFKYLNRSILCHRICTHDNLRNDFGSVMTISMI